MATIAESANPADRPKAPTFVESEAVNGCTVIALVAAGPDTGAFPQPTFVAIVPELFESVRTGSPSVPFSPNPWSEGPSPRITTVRAVDPLITNPQIKVFEPVPTNARAEMLKRRFVGAPLSASYISASATPLLLVCETTWAVWAPGTKE